jgi:hypothetical protein
MVLFCECMTQCAQKVFDTADIVREAMFRQQSVGRWRVSVRVNSRFAAAKSVGGLRRSPHNLYRAAGVAGHSF